MGRTPVVRPSLVIVVWMIAFVVSGCAGGADESSGQPPATSPPSASRQPQPTPAQSEAPSAESEPRGTIVGRATEEGSGKPLADVYIVVGYKGVQRAAITGPDGRYTVRDVPAGEPAAILGFHEQNYRYHNSEYDAQVVPSLEPGQTFPYDFTVRPLEDPAGRPQVSDPTISTETARPGDQVQFELTVTGGAGGLSDEVFASSPRLGRVAWLDQVEGDRYRGELTIPPGIAPGEYQFAFFAASNECYDPEQFPTRILRVEA